MEQYKQKNNKSLYNKISKITGIKKIINILFYKRLYRTNYKIDFNKFI